MIKINVDDDKWDKLVDDHWEWFKKRLETKFRKKSYTYKYFIKRELGWGESDLEKIVKISREELNSFPNTFCHYNDEFQDYLNNLNHKKNKKDIIHKLNLAFGFNSFTNGKRAYDFTKKIGIDVCPYCNRQYVFTIGNNRKPICRPEIDHYFPQSIFPFLSCSPANFIPSCHQCNHKKSDSWNTKDIKTRTIYPYLEGFKDYNVCFKLKYKSSRKEDLELQIIDNGNKKIKNSVKAFNLQEIYNFHEIEIIDLLKRYRNYTKFKQNEILKMIIGVKLDRVNEAEINKIFQVYAKLFRNEILGLPLDFGTKEYPLRKMKEDIINQFDEEAKNLQN